MVEIIVVVENYSKVVLEAKVPAENVPSIGDEVKVDFGDSHTRFLGGTWGKRGARGSYGFKADECDEENSIPIVICRLQT